MSYFFYVILSCLIGILEVIMVMMVITAVLSWFPVVDPSSKIVRYLHMVTDAVTYPVRKAFERWDAVSSFPLDLSFLATYILLRIVQGFLISLI